MSSLKKLNYERFSLQLSPLREVQCFHLRNTKNLSTLKRQIIREITNGNFKNCTHPTFMGNSEVNGCKWPFRFCFLSMRKARWIPPLKYLEKLKQFRGLCKNRIPLVRFIIFQTLFSKGILTFVGPWRQCRVSLLTMVNGLPKNWICTLPPLCSKTGDAANV